MAELRSVVLFIAAGLTGFLITAGIMFVALDALAEDGKLNRPHLYAILMAGSVAALVAAGAALPWAPTP